MAEDIRIPGVDPEPGPGLDREYVVDISPGMSRVLKYIGMELGIPEIAERGNDDTKFTVPQDRETLLDMHSLAFGLGLNGLRPFGGVYAMLQRFAHKLPMD